MKPSISIFFPCYNDAGTISAMVIRALQTVREITDTYEVIVVNDGSQDDSLQILGELTCILPSEFRLVNHPKNTGYGGAIRAGLAAGMTVIAITNTYPAEELGAAHRVVSRYSEIEELLLGNG